nr:OFA family MFS transporter [uncultured Bacillus sp.]
MNPKYNRWSVLVASAIINLCVGSIYAFSVFAGPLSKAHGWSMGEIMLAFTINAAIAPIPMILGGKILDKGGAKYSIMAGGAMFGAGFILTGLSDSMMALYLSYGILCGLGQGIAYSGTLGNTVKFFPDKRGLASGIVTAGYGGGTIIAAPLANYLIENHGVSSAFISMGMIYFVVTVVCALFVKAAPVGYAPEGWSPSVQATGKKAAGNDVPWNEMIKKPMFYTIAFLFMIGALSGMMVTSNASVIGQQMYGLTAAVAAVLVSLFSLSNCLGRILWGAVSDKIGRTNTLLCIYIVIAAMLLLLANTVSTAGFIIAVIGIGTCFGGTMGVFPSIVGDKFGMKYYGVNYGVTFIGYSLAAFFGPKIAVQVAGTHNGDFTLAFYIAFAISLVGIVLTLLFKRMEKKGIVIASKSVA